MTDQRRQIEVEVLLQWAYRDELPKKYMSSAEGIWANLEIFGHNGGIDGGHGAAQRYPHYGLPHPDAIAIERAVSAIPDYPLDWQSEAAELLGPLIALTTAAKAPAKPIQRFSVASWGYGPAKVKEHLEPPRGVMAPILRPAALVTMHAKMGSRPDWFDDVPIVLRIPAERGPHSKILMINEWGQTVNAVCWGKNMYPASSWCPLQWSPRIEDIAQDRADYLAWHRGLQHLAATLELAGHIVLPPTAPEFPWRDREQPPVIIDIARPKMSRLPLHPQRPTLGPPLRQPKAGKVRNVHG